jgi:hypothetical protein
MAGGVASLDDLHTAFGDLRRALDANDPDAINSATRAVKRAADTVQAQGAWKTGPELSEKLNALRPLIESARVRVNLASDDVRRRVGLLVEHGAASSATYGR